MGRGFGNIFVYFSAIWFCTAVELVPVHAATVAEVTTKVKSLKQQERLAYLLKGAQAEGERAYYGTLQIDEFLPLARV